MAVPHAVQTLSPIQLYSLSLKPYFASDALNFSSVFASTDSAPKPVFDPSIAFDAAWLVDTHSLVTFRYASNCLSVIEPSFEPSYSFSSARATGADMSTNVHNSAHSATIGVILGRFIALLQIWNKRDRHHRCRK